MKAKVITPQRVTLVHNRYQDTPFLTYAVTAEEDHHMARTITGQTKELEEGMELYFLYVLYTVAIGPYSMAGQYQVHRVFTDREEASKVRKELKLSNKVPDGIIYSGDPVLEAVYVIPATYTTQQEAFDIMEAKHVAKAGKKVTKLPTPPSTKEVPPSDNTCTVSHNRVSGNTSTGSSTRGKSRVGQASRGVPTPGNYKPRRVAKKPNTGRRKANS